MSAAEDIFNHNFPAPADPTLSAANSMVQTIAKLLYECGSAIQSASSITARVGTEPMLAALAESPDTADFIRTERGMIHLTRAKQAELIRTLVAAAPSIWPLVQPSLPMPTLHEQPVEQE